MIWKDNSLLKKDELLEDQIEAVEAIINRPIKTLLEKNPGLIIYPDKLHKGILDQQILKGFYKNHDNMAIYTSNLIGVINVPINENNTSQTIAIGSRFDNSSKQPFLIYLLTKVFDGIFIDWRTNDNQNDLFDLILIIMFFELLKKQSKQGFPRFYITRKNNDYNLRGRLNVSQHIKSNTPFVGKVAYETREQSYDNNFMWLIRYTSERIKAKRRFNREISKRIK